MREPAGRERHRPQAEFEIEPIAGVPSAAHHQSAIRYHCCPAINQTDSVGWGNRVTHWWRLAAEVPVKWAFSQKASRSESVESGRGSRPDSTAYERWRPGRKRTRRSKFGS